MSTTDVAGKAEPTPSLRVLTVCTHNRTRSVMIEALLRSMLAERLDLGVVTFRSAGFGPAGIPAIPDAIEAMRRRGLDISGHRSRQVDAGILADSDLVLATEREHVIRIASMDPAAYRRSLTLPEFTAAASRRGGDIAGDIAGDIDFASWLQAITQPRTASAYLRDPVEEVSDPTGLPRQAFERAVKEIEAQCASAAALIARVLEGTGGSAVYGR